MNTSLIDVAVGSVISSVGGAVYVRSLQNVSDRTRTVVTRGRALPFIHAKRAPEDVKGDPVVPLIGIGRAENVHVAGATMMRSLEDRMADHGHVEYATAEGNDLPAHEQTYEGFIMLVKYGTIGVVIIVALMGYFLT